MSEIDAADGECFGEGGLIHHNNLGLYDSEEITDHYAPFSLCDLTIICLYNKG